MIMLVKTVDVNGIEPNHSEFERRSDDGGVTWDSLSIHTRDGEDNVTLNEMFNRKQTSDTEKKKLL